MLLIRTIVGPSQIHGVGVFADEDVAEGRPIWRFAEGFDLVIPSDRIAALPDSFRHHLDTYAYRSADIPDAMVLSCDHARFLNHSDDPNTGLRPFETVARRAIRKGDEITCDYRAFVVDWDGFGPQP